MCSLIRPVSMVLQSLSGRNKEHCLIFLQFFLQKLTHAQLFIGCHAQFQLLDATNTLVWMFL